MYQELTKEKSRDEIKVIKKGLNTISDSFKKLKNLIFHKMEFIQHIFY
jgi:hypothetical protein